MDDLPDDDFAEPGMRTYSAKVFIDYPRWYGSRRYERTIAVEAPIDAGPGDIRDLILDSPDVELILSPNSGIRVQVVISA